MATDHIRNAIAILFVLTLAALGAAVTDLLAVRDARQDMQVRLAHVDAVTTQLVDVVTRLCAQRGETCSPPASDH